MTGSSPERVSFCRAQSAVALGSSKAPSAAGPFPPDLRPWHRSFRSLAVSSSRGGGGGRRRRGDGDAEVVTAHVVVGAIAWE